MSDKERGREDAAEDAHDAVVLVEHAPLVRAELGVDLVRVRDEAPDEIRLALLQARELE